MPTDPVTPTAGVETTNPNALHEYHAGKRGPRNVPQSVRPRDADVLSSTPKDPGHSYAATSKIRFDLYDQRSSNAPFGYEHFVSLPLAYDDDSTSKRWPLILFLHGAGESQKAANESYASICHGIPKIVLCYDKLTPTTVSTDGNRDEVVPWPWISIPPAPRLRKSKQLQEGDKSADSVDPEVCRMLAENFITVTPSLDMRNGYGWNASILSALLDEIIDRYPVDVDRVHVTGFSMGGYGTWSLAMHTPDRFASLMPICGGGDGLRATFIKDVPQWVHHGDQDDIIPVRASLDMVKALEKAGAAEVKLSRYPDLMHDSWTAAYGDRAVYEWMLNTRRSRAGDERAVPAENKVLLTD